MRIISVVFQVLTWRMPSDRQCQVTDSGCPESWKEYGNSCYLFITLALQSRRMSWEDSRANCKRHGGDLVSILDSSEVDFIHQQTSALGYIKFWIGLYRNKTTSDPKEGWVWSDGSNFTNPQQWLPGEPNNRYNEYCAELFSKNKWWNDNECSDLYYSICKRKKGLVPTSGTLPTTKAVRLVGLLVGGLNNAGRVEVYYNGTWGTVCNGNWDICDAHVVCRQLGFQFALDVYEGARYGLGSGPIWLDDVDCLGSESSLFWCRHNGLGNHNCYHSEDASVQCGANGAVRLFGGSYSAGRVEVYYNGTWGTVCDDDWDINDAHVVCRQLGFRYALNAYKNTHYCQGTGLILLDDVDCLGNETSLLSCKHSGVMNHNCSLSQDASVQCRANGDVRLVGGSDIATGRVEVYYNGTWGTVCQNGWDISSGHVVCRQLGFRYALNTYRNARYGQGTGLILLDDVDCLGSETSLLSCKHSGVMNHNCRHSEDASVQCRANGVVQLVGGSNNEGRVEIYYNGTWGTVCDDEWDIDDARVVCRQLGFRHAEQYFTNAHFGEGTGKIWLDSVNCTGHESSLSLCQSSGWGDHNCRHKEDAGIRCNTKDKTTEPHTKTTSKPSEKYQNNSTIDSGGKSKDNTVAIAGGVSGALIFFIIVVVIVFLIQRKIMREKYQKSLKELHALHVIRNPRTRRDTLELPLRPEPETADVAEMIILSYVAVLEDWEIAQDNLKLLDKKLGEGQFGIVRQGLLTTGEGHSEVVAVKTLKDGAKTSDLQDLMTELTILKDVNKIPHPNVVRFVGGCSIEGKLHIVTEFCSGGSLRHLLIKSRINPSEDSPDYLNMTSTLNHRELLKLAVDVANGMAHLSSQKLVHRDLAARNILIGDENTAKISDFGLARDVKGVYEYTRSNHNLLPVKWMALESLFYGHFTTASDVWSYGILLHEITTLGEEPYKNILPQEIIGHLASGHRMSQPPQCSNELYEIMTRCWKTEQKERPTFAEIYELLHSMLMDDKRSYITITQILDEGSVTTTQEHLEQEDLSSKSKDESQDEKQMPESVE